MTNDNISSLFRVTEIELIYHNKINPAERLKVISPEQAYTTMLSSWDMNKIELVEQFSIMLLDQANKCLGISNIATGGVASCIADPKVIFAAALKSRASGVILAHNHPSGNLQPSQQDLRLTDRLREGGKLLDVNVLDHLIISPHSFYSFASEGLIYSGW